MLNLTIDDLPQKVKAFNEILKAQADCVNYIQDLIDGEEVVGGDLKDERVESAVQKKLREVEKKYNIYRIRIDYGVYAVLLTFEKSQYSENKENKYVKNKINIAKINCDVDFDKIETIFFKAKEQMSVEVYQKLLEIEELEDEIRDKKLKLKNIRSNYPCLYE